ncbi:hypothetical protein ACFX2C_035219 [Malus domestica]
MVTKPDPCNSSEFGPDPLSFLYSPSCCPVMVSEEVDMAAEMKPEPQPLSMTLLATNRFMCEICSSTSGAQPAMEAKAVDEQITPTDGNSSNHDNVDETPEKRSQIIDDEKAIKQKEINDWLPITSSRNANWWYVAFHNVNSMVGAGVLGLPFATSNLR